MDNTYVNLTCSWGITSVNSSCQHSDSHPLVFKDAIVTNNAAWTWNWADPDFKHEPGYTAAFLKAYATEKCFDLILCSTGMHGNILVSSDATAYAFSLQGRVKFARTPETVAEFNRCVAKGLRVIAFVHSTC